MTLTRQESVFFLNFYLCETSGIKNIVRPSPRAFLSAQQVTAKIHLDTLKHTHSGCF